jgi:hypothetical protein
MLFIAGLETLPREDAVKLVAQLNVFKTATLLRCGCADLVGKVKGFFGMLPLLGRYPDVGIPIDATINRPLSEVEKTIELAQRELELLADTEIQSRLRGHLVDLAELPSGRNTTAVACAVVLRAAKSFKIDSTTHSSPLTLENAVFEACVRELVDQIKATLAKISSGDAARLEALLREQLGRISAADADAIRRATGIEELSAKALLSFLKTSSSTAIASLVVSSLGFAPFLALTTAMKAITLLVGVTLPFATYTAASSTLAFLLSGPFLLAVLAVIGSVGWKRADNAIRDQLVRLVILVGRANTLAGGEPDRNA